jgi:hypothetical protein
MYIHRLTYIPTNHIFLVVGLSPEVLLYIAQFLGVSVVSATFLVNAISISGQIPRAD